MATPGTGAVDYLGRDAPLSFEGTPALPVGGSGMGATAAPSTDAGGFVPTPEAPVDDMARIMDELRRLGMIVEPGGTGGNAGGVGPGAEGTISGFDPGLVATALSTLGLAAGIPGIVGTVTGLATGVPGAESVPGVPSVGSLVSLLDALGLLPESNLTMNTEQGPVAVGVNNAPQGILGLLGALLGITPTPTFSVANPDANLGELTSAQISEINMTPELQMQSPVSPTLGVVSTSPSFGWTDTSGIALSPPGGDAPPGGAPPSAPPGIASVSPDDPGQSAPGAPGTGTGGVGGEAGTGGGTSGPGGGAASGEAE